MRQPRKARDLRGLRPPRVTGIEPGSSSVRLTLAEGGSVTAQAGRGRRRAQIHRSRCSRASRSRSWGYPQAAIVTSFGHTRPHNGTVNELHRRSGPLTTVPLPGIHSSLVWVEEPHEAQRIAVLHDDAFRRIARSTAAGRARHHATSGPRLLYPLSGSSTERMAARRIALVGEAAHVIPPIGAQGLNLGLRDAAALADCVAEAQALGQDIGGRRCSTAYQRARGGDVAARSAAIDLLNRSLAHGFPAVRSCCAAPRCMRSPIPARCAAF